MQVATKALSVAYTAVGFISLSLCPSRENGYTINVNFFEKYGNSRHLCGFQCLDFVEKGFLFHAPIFAKMGNNPLSFGLGARLTISHVGYLTSLRYTHLGSML